MSIDDSPETSAGAVGEATAPGSLPIGLIEERTALLREHFRHDNTISPLAPRPGEPVRVCASSGEALDLDAAAVFYTTDGSLPSACSPRVSMEGTSVEWGVQTGYLTGWQADVPPQPAGTHVRYRIGGWLADGPHDPALPDLWAHDGQGFWFRFPGDRGITTFAYRVEEPRLPMPAWMDSAVIYQIFLDRFHPGVPGEWTSTNGPMERHGGTLDGVRHSLPYLAELGVNCIWLSPLSPAESYHRYDGLDYHNVDPALGGNYALHALTAEAHARGIRVLLDFVPSHSSWHHPAFLAAQADRSAPTSSWYTFEEWPDRYRCFLQRAPQLPSFNTDDPGARAYLIDSALHWVREFGVDGFRLDHVIAPSMDFWVAFQSALEEVKADIVTIGEATDTPDSLRHYRGRLNAILDFPLATALRHTFATGLWDLERFDSNLRAYERFMADGPGRVSFLDNHDMNRFLFLARGDIRRLRLGALAQFTLQPTPVVYYGTEIGMDQAGDANALRGGDHLVRADMPWDEDDWDREVLDFYRALIRLRTRAPWLAGRGRRTVHLDPRGTYAYLRAGNGESMAVAFNLSEESRQIALPQRVGEVLIATDEAVEAVGRTVRLPAMSGGAFAYGSG